MGMTNTLTVGTKVRDADIVRIYGVENALVGTISRIYDLPIGMVEVNWEDEGPAEDVWADELERAAE